MEGLVKVTNDVVFLSFSLSSANNGTVHKIFQASLEIRVKIGSPKHWKVKVAMDIKRVLKNDFILSQGSCLIRTKDVDSP